MLAVNKAIPTPVAISVVNEPSLKRNKRQSVEDAIRQAVTTQLTNADEIISHCSERTNNYSSQVDYAINLAYQANSPQKTQRLHDFMMLMKGVGDQPVSGQANSDCWGSIRRLITERLVHDESTNNRSNEGRSRAYASLREAATSAGILSHVQDILTVREQQEEERGRNRILFHQCYFAPVSCY